MSTALPYTIQDHSFINSLPDIGAIDRLADRLKDLAFDEFRQCNDEPVWKASQYKSNWHNQIEVTHDSIRLGSVFNREINSVIDDESSQEWPIATIDGKLSISDTQIAEIAFAAKKDEARQKFLADLETLAFSDLTRYPCPPSVMIERILLTHTSKSFIDIPAEFVAQATAHPETPIVTLFEGPLPNSPRSLTFKMSILADRIEGDIPYPRQPETDPDYPDMPRIVFTNKKAVKTWTDVIQAAATMGETICDASGVGYEGFTMSGDQVAMHYGT